MKHSITEIVATGMCGGPREFFKVGYWEQKYKTPLGKSLKWLTCDFNSRQGSFEYTDLDGIKKIAWQLDGETWFDTKEERENARTELKKKEIKEQIQVLEKELARLKELEKTL
jgi:hypothetical protein